MINIVTVFIQIEVPPAFGSLAHTINILYENSLMTEMSEYLMP